MKDIKRKIEWVTAGVVVLAIILIVILYYRVVDLIEQLNNLNF